MLLRKKEMILKRKKEKEKKKERKKERKKEWNVTPLLGDFGGIVGYCGIL